MSFNSGDTLGNHRFVSRVPAKYYVWSAGHLKALEPSIGAATTDLKNVLETMDVTGGVTTPIAERGTVMAIRSVKPGSDEHVVFNLSNATEAFAKIVAAQHMTVGVLAEAMGDNTRRRTRPGRTPLDLVLPMTFQGIDLATAPCTEHNAGTSTCEAFCPGDPVYALFEVRHTGYRLVKTVPVIYSPSAPPAALHIGVCHVGTTGGAAVQVRVDSMATDVI